MRVDFFQVFDDMVKEEAAAALEAAKQTQAPNSQAQLPTEPEPVLDPEPDPDPDPDPVPVQQPAAPQVQQPQQG